MKSKHIRSQLTADDGEHILHVAPTTPVYDRIIKDKAIATLIREIDAQHFEEEYTKSKLADKWK